MKRIIRCFSILMVFALMSCGGGNSDAEGGENSGDSTDASIDEDASEFADIPDLMAKSDFTTDEFIRLTDFLNEKEVTLTGYPHAYALGEGTEIEFTPNRSDLIDGIDNTQNNCSVSLKFKSETEVRTMKLGDLIAVKGVLDVSYSLSEEWGNTCRISLKDAEFVDEAEDVAGALAAIADIDLTKQIFCGDLYSIMDAHYSKLIDKGEITVTGRYISTTTSSATEGEVLEIRVDLGASGSKVGCEMIAEPDGDALVEKRNAGEDISIQGVFSGINWEPRISQGVVK